MAAKESPNCVCIETGRCGVTSCVLICSGVGDTTGVGGSGLLTSEFSLDLAAGAGAGSEAEKLSKDTTWGCLGATSLPWRCFGAGGGFFLPFFTSDTRPMLSSSSDSAPSYDVLGDSGCVSCGCSNNDCRDTDDVSVLLLLSNWTPLGMLGRGVACGDCPDWRGPALPVMSRFLKLSTSNDALLLPDAARSANVRSSPLPICCGSIDANVLENGFAGMPAGETTDCGACFPLRVPDHVSAVGVSFLHPVVCGLGFPEKVSGSVALAECASGEGST